MELEKICLIWLLSEYHFNIITSPHQGARRMSMTFAIPVLCSTMNPVGSKGAKQLLIIICGCYACSIVGNPIPIRQFLWKDWVESHFRKLSFFWSIHFLLSTSSSTVSHSKQNRLGCSKSLRKLVANSRDGSGWSVMIGNNKIIINIFKWSEWIIKLLCINGTGRLVKWSMLIMQITCPAHNLLLVIGIRTKITRVTGSWVHKPRPWYFMANHMHNSSN